MSPHTGLKHTVLKQSQELIPLVLTSSCSRIIASMKSNRCSFIKNRFIPRDCLAEDHYPQTHMWPGLDFFSSHCYPKILRKISVSLQQYANGLPSSWIPTSQGRSSLQEHDSPWEPAQLLHTGCSCFFSSCIPLTLFLCSNFLQKYNFQISNTGEIK